MSLIFLRCHVHLVLIHLIFTKFWVPSHACMGIKRFFLLSLVMNFVGKIPVYFAVEGSLVLTLKTLISRILGYASI
jgi:Na+/melibiose symporter-like transporter